MKITTHIQYEQTKNLLGVCFDVSKDSLELYAEIQNPGHSIDKVEHKFPNRSKPIIRELQRLKDLAIERGYNGIRIICEPTGGYERRLLHLGRKHGCHTAYVNGESVYKAQIIEGNDYNKTDQKDPKTIHLLVKLGKTLRHRNINGQWAVMREYNVRYERLESDMIAAKNHIHKTIQHLFCEMSFKNDWLFNSHAAENVVTAYGLNPYRIIHCGEGKVRKRLRGMKVTNATITRLIEDSRLAVMQEMSPDLADFYEQDLRVEFEGLKRCQQQMQRIRTAMIKILYTFIDHGHINIVPHKDLISPFMLARIIAETGPLDDFENIKQLYRYAGLKIRQKQSGLYKGQNKLSKKGRPLLRKVLSQAIIKRVTKNDLYGAYYHGKKDQGMIGPKAMTAVARKYLKLLYGLHKSKQSFSKIRTFECQSQFKQAA